MAPASPLGYVSTIHRVLEIPEIVELILTFLDQKGNINNALVCKRWSEISLDILWREVDDLPRLCSVLAPLYAQQHRVCEVRNTHF